MTLNLSKAFNIFNFLACYCILPVSSKEQYVEPLLFGMKATLPYDMANLFNEFPIQGGLALLLGLGIMFILFFGVITSPFGYMFGVPSEKYVMGDFKIPHPEVAAAEKRIMYSIPSNGAPRSFLLDYVNSVKGSPRTIFSDKREDQEEEQCCQTFLYYFDAILGYFEFWEPGFLEKWKPSLNVLRSRLGGKVGKDIVNTVESSLRKEYRPDFIHSIFYLIPEEEDIRSNEACQLRMVCHAHGAIQYLPVSMLKIYHKFSKKLTKIPKEYVEAMRLGMMNETLCAEAYSVHSATPCLDNAFTLTLKSYMSLLPYKDQIGGMPRRKHKMYKNFNKK
ncbi:unnamed protein product [Orchesella dallaii]|uniref:Uncharacterized protein n=1 Tax=Orchesella dallaii TaxID=48710 RepID=A0ABP1QER9_9HEXA